MDNPERDRHRRLVGDSATPSRKEFFEGTHRVCTPEATLARIQPLLQHIGITRLADVTWLDEIGIPVYQAIRPNAKTLSVSQGKGLTRPLAKVSAAMESIELWHAENLRGTTTTATVGEIATALGYRVEELSLVPRHHLSRGTVLEWTPALRLTDGSTTAVPTAYLRLDSTVQLRWSPLLFYVTSNGLASGNTLEEAALHALYEVVERDALARSRDPVQRRPLTLYTVDGHARWLLERFQRAGVDVQVDVLSSPTGIPCFFARIWHETFPAVFLGSGSHLDRDVALCRSLTEAAQSRVTAIAGGREDVHKRLYRWAHASRSAQARLRPGSVASPCSLQDVEFVRMLDLRIELREVVLRIARATSRAPLLIDLTRPNVSVPVVRVVCPGMLLVDL